MTLTLIDGDIVAYRCAASAENENKDIAVWRVGDLMQRIMHETESSAFQGFLTGSNNFRYDIYPEYKAHRKKKPKPQFLEACRESLVINWKCQVTDGIEADDALGIEHQANPGSVLASIDKDLLQLPGRHYNFVKQTWTDIDELQGLRNFYTQLIEGDASDNIPAWDGKLRTSRPKFVAKLIDPLYDLFREDQMYEYVADLYQDHWQEVNMPGESITWEFDNSLLHRNAQLLYIQKKENDKWGVPIMMDNGVQGGSEDLYDQLSAVPRNDGLQNMPVLP